MRRLMFLALCAAAFAVPSVSAQQTAPPARPAVNAPTPTAAPMVEPPQDVPPSPPQRGRGIAQGVPGGNVPSGQQGGRGGRGSANGPTPAAASGRGGFFPASASMENVKIDVVLADTITQSGGKKTVSMVVTNNRKGQIRSSGNGGYTLNVDAQPQMLQDGRILVALELLYLPETSGEAKPAAVINESLSVIVGNGTSMQVSQSADPRSDRKVTVELTASVLK